MKSQFELKLVPLVGLAFLIFVFSFSFVDAAKFQSGVTIKGTTSADTCPDSNKDGVNDNTGAICTSETPPAEGTCGLRITSGVPINYGELTIGQESPEKTIQIINEGTSQTPAKIMIKGADWISDELQAGSHLRIAGPEVTKVSIAQANFDNKKSLSSNGWELGQITGGQSLPVYFQLRMDTAPSGSVGAFHQDVTVDLLC